MATAGTRPTSDNDTRPTVKDQFSAGHHPPYVEMPNERYSMAMNQADRTTPAMR